MGWLRVLIPLVGVLGGVSGAGFVPGKRVFGDMGGGEGWRRSMYSYTGGFKYGGVFPYCSYSVNDASY